MKDNTKDKIEIKKVEAAEHEIIAGDHNTSVTLEPVKTKKKKSDKKDLVITDYEGADFLHILSSLVQYMGMIDSVVRLEADAHYEVKIPLDVTDPWQLGQMLLGKDQIPEGLEGNPFQDYASNLHYMYMEQAVSELADQMQATYKSVERIEQGQKDDRIGMLMAGKNQILLAMGLPEGERKTAMALARNQIATSQQQIFRSMKRRVEEFESIPEEPFTRFRLEMFHPGYLRSKDQEFDDIQDYYSLYLQATEMLAASYAVCGDLATAEKTYQLSINEMKDVNFDKVKTLSLVHKNQKDMLYDHAVEYIETEKNIRMEEAKSYDSITVKVSGAALIEMLENTTGGSDGNE